MSYSFFTDESTIFLLSSVIINLLSLETVPSLAFDISLNIFSNYLVFLGGTDTNTLPWLSEKSFTMAEFEPADMLSTFILHPSIPPTQAFANAIPKPPEVTEREEFNNSF